MSADVMLMTEIHRFLLDVLRIGMDAISLTVTEYNIAQDNGSTPAQLIQPDAKKYPWSSRPSSKFLG